MTLNPNTLKTDLENLQKLIQSGSLDAATAETAKQKLAGQSSTLLSAGQSQSGITSLTDQLNHLGTLETAPGDGIARLDANITGFENDVKTDISSSTSDLSTMTGETIESGFRKLYYGGTGTNAVNALLADATGKDTTALVSVLQTLQTGDLKSLIASALTTTLQSKLAPALAQISNLINTFIPSNIGLVLQDIVDKSDGSLSFKLSELAEGNLGPDELALAMQYISQKRFIDAINLIAGVSSKPYSEIEAGVYGMSTQLFDRLTPIDNDLSSLAPLSVGTTRAGFDDPTDANSKFSIIRSYEELEADMRSASREITEYVLHWSESATNQYLTAEDLNDIQSGIRYHYVILKNGQIQRGLPINTVGNHIPTAVVAQTVAQNNPNQDAFIGEVQSRNSQGNQNSAATANHNKYSIGVCIIGGIAAAAGAPEYERYLSKNSITDPQWKTIDGMFATFFKAFPGGQVFGHNSIEPNEPDPGFDVQSYCKKRMNKWNTSPNALSVTQLNGSADTEIDYANLPSGVPDTGATLTSRVFMDSSDTSRVPKQNIINSIDAAVRQLGYGYQARITPQGGKYSRPSGTKNHPTGEAADHYLTREGIRINPNQNRQLYNDYITILVRNAKSRGIRPGIGGYTSFIHYDESPWRQGKAGTAGTWGSGTAFARNIA